MTTDKKTEHNQTNVEEKRHRALISKILVVGIFAIAVYFLGAVLFVFLIITTAILNLGGVIEKLFTLYIGDRGSPVAKNIIKIVSYTISISFLLILFGILGEFMNASEQNKNINLLRGATYLMGYFN